MRKKILKFFKRTFKKIRRFNFLGLIRKKPKSKLLNLKRKPKKKSFLKKLKWLLLGEEKK